MHVFIENGLAYQLGNQNGPIKILEIGFGTGLNALLTLRQSLKSDFRVDYTTIERFPLSNEIISKLNYTSHLEFPEGANHFVHMHQCEWGTAVKISNQFTLRKLNLDLLEDQNLGENLYGLVYYDAFAPSRQPQMWRIELLSTVIRAMKPGSSFVTYCAKGQLKRDLKSLNMQVQTLAGPPGKKEMVRAVYNG